MFLGTFLFMSQSYLLRQQNSKQISVIHLLIPIIRGWTNYHRYLVASEIFHYVDHEIYKCLWNWSKRRHPKKPAYWIKKRYFKKIGNRDWFFSDGKKVLFLASRVKIQRYIKIKGDANPFDIEYETYFENRLQKKMLKHISKKKDIKYTKGISLCASL